MPKFKSVCIKKEKRDAHGVIEEGQTVWVPLDDAAILEPEVEAAIEAKEWKHPDGRPVTKDEWLQMKEEIKKRFDEKKSQFIRSKPRY